MIISNTNSVSSIYAASNISSMQQQTVSLTDVNSTDNLSSSPFFDKVTISDAAKAMMADSQAAVDAQEIQKQLDAIKAKPAVERSPNEVDFVSKNDKHFTELAKKGYDSLKSDEVDYMQKAGGLVNTSIDK